MLFLAARVGFYCYTINSLSSDRNSSSNSNSMPEEPIVCQQYQQSASSSIIIMPVFSIQLAVVVSSSSSRLLVDQHQQLWDRLAERKSREWVVKYSRSQQTKTIILNTDSTLVPHQFNQMRKISFLMISNGFQKIKKNTF